MSWSASIFAPCSLDPDTRHWTLSLQFTAPFDEALGRMDEYLDPVVKQGQVLGDALPEGAKLSKIRRDLEAAYRQQNEAWSTVFTTPLASISMLPFQCAEDAVTRLEAAEAEALEEMKEAAGARADKIVDGIVSRLEQKRADALAELALIAGPFLKRINELSQAIHDYQSHREHWIEGIKTSAISIQE